MVVTPLAAPKPELSQVQAPGSKKTEDSGFGDLLKQAMDSVNELQKSADTLTQQYLAGETDNIHQVMLVTQQAEMALELTVQVRNKIVEAYQEISRMQI